MKNYIHKHYELGYGGLGMFFFGAIIAVAMYFFIFPSKFYQIKPNETLSASSIPYCRDFVDENEAPVIELPAYDGKGHDNSPQVIPGQKRKYRLLKQNVPFSGLVFHFKAIGNYTDPESGKTYSIQMPASEQGTSYPFLYKDQDGNLKEQLQGFRFADYGMLYLLHPDGPIGQIQGGKEFIPIILADIYKAVDLPDLPPEVINCVEMGTSLPEDMQPPFELFYPEQNWSPMKAEEQLGYFLPKREVLIYGSAWWTPHCKPAIYLYPEKETQVNVKLAIPNGSFLYTDPIYPSGGWTVLAKPNGDIIYSGNLADSKGRVNYPSGVFPYLYYEAKIHNSVIEKPTEGFVVAYDRLPQFYSDILSKLGLNEKETIEFKDYWEKALPYSPYYFIGIVPQTNLDEIEPLTITPKQDTTIRVSLYFEALDAFKVVQQPIIQTPKRKGFTVVEWGGMVKTDKDHPFTCVM